MKFVTITIKAMAVSLLLTISAIAKPSQDAPGNASASSTWLPTQRMLVFGGRNNWQDTTGQILVCNLAFDWRECAKESGNKNWMLLQNYPMPAGWRIVQLQYAFVGRDGERVLLVLISKD